MKYQNVAEMVHSQAEEMKEKTFLIFGDKEVSYQQLDSWCLRLANYLTINLKITAQENIGILLPNSIDFVVSFIGTMYGNFTAMPYNTLLKAEELLYQLNHSEIKTLVTNAHFYKVIAPVMAELKFIQNIIITDDTNVATGSINFWQAIETSAENLPNHFKEIKTSDIASMIYTSGTTGRPKAVMLSHSNYISDIVLVIPRVGYLREDTNLCIMPLFHVNGQVASVLATIYAGATLVLEEMFKPRSFIPTLKKYRCSSFSAVPAMYNFLNEMPEYKDGEDLSFLKACICGAAPMPVEVFNKFEKKFKGTIIEGYGLSEGTCVSSLNPINGERKIGSIGTTLEGQEMAIFDGKGKTMPDTEIGEIVIKGPNVMVGYFKNEKATRESIQNGWLHTGDMGFRDKDGYYFITGRKKEMIIRGGENIYPKEIEEALYQHEAILDCAVIGLPDKKYGEQVVAVVQLKEGCEETAKSIRTFLKPKIANFKMPAQYEFVTEFPKTSTGKIQKLKLREQFEMMPK